MEISLGYMRNCLKTNRNAKQPRSRELGLTSFLSAQSLTRCFLLQKATGETEGDAQWVQSLPCKLENWNSLKHQLGVVAYMQSQHLEEGDGVPRTC